jgi:hypothetical protein
MSYGRENALAIMAASAICGLIGAAPMAQAQMDKPCPTTLDKLPATGMVCMCSAAQMAQGDIYGMGRYTSDSSICRAALHAMVAAASGGPITFYEGGNCARYMGFTSNGVTSQKWDQPHPRSFAFFNPVPNCPQQ